MWVSEATDANSSLSETLVKFVAIRKYSGNNIESVAFDLYKCLSTVAKSDITYMYLYLKILHNRETDIKIPKHFRIIFMSSLRHLKILSSSGIDCIRFFIYLLVKDVFAILDPLDFRTIHLLKVLNQVVLKNNWVIDVYQLILSKLYTLLYATPITPLKSLSLEIINDIELNNSMCKPHLETCLTLMLITNFENSRSRFSIVRNYYIMQNITEYMKFIFKFFHFNVHNRAAGIVYKCIISRFNIHEFQEYVWPFWRGYLEKEIEKSEFSQSLVKYWIPYTVDCYGIDIFTFFCTQEISQSFLLLVIYELRRKRHISVENLYDGIIFETLLCCVENENTFEKSMEICCTFPVLNEKISKKCFDIIEKYLLLNNYWSAYFEKSINKLLSHIFISEHVNSLKPAYKFLYDNFISKLSNYITRNLTSRISTYVSLKLCMNLIEIMKKPSKDFKLSYDLPKRFAYNFEENRYYLYLHKNGIFDLLTTKKNFITDELIKFINQGNIVDDLTISLLIKEFNCYSIEDLKLCTIYAEGKIISLDSLEKHKNIQKIILQKIFRESPEIVYKKYLGNFVDKILDSLPHIDITDVSVETMFEVLKNLTVLITGCEIKNSIEFSVSCTLTHSLLDFIVAAVENGSHEGLSIKTRKVLEYLFCHIIKLVEVLKAVRKKNCILIFNKLIILIEKSNIRKLVTDAMTLTMLISEEMENSDCLKIKRAKHKYFGELVNSICNLTEFESSKMRKHPQKRAFLHAMCKGSAPNQQVYVREAISKMMVKLRSNDLNSAVHTVILECLEILLAEPCFHSYTYTYAEEIIELSIQSFQSKIWPVKNAAIQLINLLISRFFGIQQTDTVRLKSFQEFCILFPKLGNKFYDILSEPILDERAVVILQYISSSEVLVYEHLEKQSKNKIEDFLFLFENILVSNESFITKFIPQAFVSLCPEKDYSYYLGKISNFIIKCFNNKPSNIIVNHLLLFKEFVTRINKSYSLSNSEVSNLNSILHLNNFLRMKTAPYLDLMNIRCFQLSQKCYSCTCNLQIAISSKEWYVANFIYNLCSFQITETDQYSRIFDFLINEKKFNFLLDQYLHFLFDTIEDLQVLSEITNSILNQIFLLRYNMNVTLYKILIGAVLKVTINCEDKTISVINIPESIEDFNLYESIAIQIILANGYHSNHKELYVRTFSTLSKLSNFGNFEIDMLPQILIVVQKNLNHNDKYVFMKLLLYQILSNCDDENIVVLVYRLGLKNVNLENSARKVLNLDFLYSYFHEKNEVEKFLKSAMLLIRKFEMSVKICTFYLDTHNKLEEYKCIIRESIQEMTSF